MGLFLDKINNLIDTELELNKDRSAKARWELLKASIHSSVIQYSCHKQKSNRNKLQVLEKSFKL